MKRSKVLISIGAREGTRTPTDEPPDPKAIYIKRI